MGAHFHHPCLTGTWDELDSFRARTLRRRLGRRRQRRIVERARASGAARARGWERGRWAVVAVAGARRSLRRASDRCQRWNRSTSPSRQESFSTSFVGEQSVRPSVSQLAQIYAFILGACIGSFLNVCIVRWPHERSILRPRSRCPQCGNQLAWFENVPILSWIALRGRCRCCDEPISIDVSAHRARRGDRVAAGRALLRADVHRASRRRLRHRPARRRDDRCEALSHSRRLHAVRARVRARDVRHRVLPRRNPGVRHAVRRAQSERVLAQG